MGSSPARGHAVPPVTWAQPRSPEVCVVVRCQAQGVLVGAYWCVSAVVYYFVSLTHTLICASQ